MNKGTTVWSFLRIEIWTSFSGCVRFYSHRSTKRTNSSSKKAMSSKKSSGWQKAKHSLSYQDLKTTGTFQSTPVATSVSSTFTVPRPLKASILRTLWKTSIYSSVNSLFNHPHQTMNAKHSNSVWTICIKCRINSKQSSKICSRETISTF